MERIKISRKQDRATQNCESCGVSHCTETNILICGGCHWVGYCSLTCQEMDWENHKRFCRSFSCRKSCLHNNTKGKTDQGDVINGMVITIKNLGEAEMNRDSKISDVMKAIDVASQNLVAARENLDAAVKGHNLVALEAALEVYKIQNDIFKTSIDELLATRKGEQEQSSFVD